MSVSKRRHEFGFYGNHSCEFKYYYYEILYYCYEEK